MVTGASTSQVAIILIDARKGVIEQTKRHFTINNLLRVKEIIVVINKMDLVDYRKERYEEIKKHFNELLINRTYKEQVISFIPLSALKGDNVVVSSKKMPWYKGSTLLDYLENLNHDTLYNKEETRFSVQYVIRPKTKDFHDFRGYAGKIYGGSIEVGDEVIVYPSLTKTTIKEIFFHDKKYQQASNRSSVTITLNNDVNISRGDMLVKANETPKVSRNITSTVCWLNREQLSLDKVYTLQHGIHKVLAKVKRINYMVKTDLLDRENNTSVLNINDIASIDLTLNKSVFYDSFENHKDNGSFILIDNQSNNTVAVGFIK
jgi:sulfate adenylyltransferase subunit 1